MLNAHHRLAQVECTMQSKSWSTSVKVWSDRFAYDGATTLMLSLFGNSTEMSAVSGAIATGVTLQAVTPDGKGRGIHLGEKQTTYRSQLSIPGRARPVQHNLFFSRSLMENGTNGTVYVLYDDAALIWSTVISFLGLPATPKWAFQGVQMLRATGKIKIVGGFNCSPVAVAVDRNDLLAWWGEQMGLGKLSFPEKNGPIAWPIYGLRDLLDGPPPEEPLAQASGF
jgi:hypothetical protein